MRRRSKPWLMLCSCSLSSECLRCSSSFLAALSSSTGQSIVFLWTSARRGAGTNPRPTRGPDHRSHSTGGGLTNPAWINIPKGREKTRGLLFRSGWGGSCQFTRERPCRGAWIFSKGGRDRKGSRGSLGRLPSCRLFFPLGRNLKAKGEKRIPPVRLESSPGHWLPA